MALVVFSYFGYHAYRGDNGINSHIKMQQKLVSLDQELAAKIKLRRKLASRVALLRDGTIEKDMLDEQVRRNLGMVHKNDIVLLR